MGVAIRVPERKDGVVIDACRRGANVGAFHGGIASVKVLHHRRVDEQVIESGVENGALLIGASFHFNAAQVVLPGLACFLAQGVEILALLFFKVAASSFDADERNAHLHFYLFAFFKIVREEATDVVA